MKPLNLFCLLFFIVFVSSCKKDSVTNTPTTKTKIEILTSHTWMYDEYFRFYNGTTPTLYFKKGRTNNYLDLTLNRVTFRTDGTYTEITETGSTLNGTWKFLNNETQVQVVNSVGTFTSTIIILDDTKYHWFDPINSNGTFGEMIPQ